MTLTVPPAVLERELRRRLADLQRYGFDALAAMPETTSGPLWLESHECWCTIHCEDDAEHVWIVVQLEPERRALVPGERCTGGFRMNRDGTVVPMGRAALREYDGEADESDEATAAAPGR